MYKEEIIVRIIDKINFSYQNLFDNQELKNIIGEILYEYDIKPIEKALIIRNNILDKAFLYIASKKIDGLSDLTLKGYVLHLKDFYSKVSKNIEDINVMDIRLYLGVYARTGVKKSTLSTKISVLKSFFSWLMIEEYITKNPMNKIKNIKVDNTLREPLSADELESLRFSCKTARQQALVEIFYATGSRLDEITKLNRSDVNWDNMSINVVGKGGKERTVYFNAKTKLYLSNYLKTRTDNCEALLITERKPYRRTSNRAIQREISKIGKLAGINRNIFPHLLRHTTATNLLNNGADLTTVQKILGHSDPSTTLIYSKLSQQNVENQYRKHMIQ